ncbi:MAG: hypothetical protein B7Y45_03020 [Sphingomonas sp. 28-66-16]|nr:MAG: hypothetical protein B7Y45_03020 [Sphingomonas sp. 28-66-16]
MPIDLAAIARAYAPLRAEMNRLIGAFTPLGPWLADRLGQLRILEPRTRAFPVYAFEGRAIVGRTAGAQAGTLRPYGSIGGAFAAPFVALGRGFLRAGQAVTDELILPDLLGAIRDIVAAIDTQIAAFATPRAAMFDPRNARAGQLFGLAAMAYRAVVSSTGQLRALAGDFATMRGLLGIAPYSPAPPPGVPTRPGEPGADIPRSINAEPLDTASRYIVAALIVVPALPDLVGSVVRAVWHGVRLAVLTAIQSIERRLWAARRTVYDVFLHTLPRLLRKIPALMTVFGLLIAQNIQHFMEFAQVYFELLVDVLRDFLNELRDYINHFITIINTVLGVIDAVLDFDLLRLIKPFMGLGALVLDYFSIRFTINDLLDAAGAGVNLALYAALQGSVMAARAAVWAMPGATGRAARRALKLLSQIIDALFQDTGAYPDETAAPRLPRMPNLYDTLIGPRGVALGRMVAAWGAQLAGDIAGIVEVGTRTLSGLAETFSTAAADLARTGPRTDDFAHGAADTANALFADQIGTLGARQARVPGALEGWLAGGGFDAIGAAIPLYIQSMRRFWRDEVAAGRDAMVEITPTSPHILARRAVLGRVHFARLEIRAGGRPIDEALVRDTAERFQRAVRDAYDDGQRRLALVANG